MNFLIENWETILNVVLILAGIPAFAKYKGVVTAANAIKAGIDAYAEHKEPLPNADIKKFVDTKKG